MTVDTEIQSDISEDNGSSFMVRLERAQYKDNGDLKMMKHIFEKHFESYEEALDVYNNYIIEDGHEMLFLVEMYYDGDQDNITSRGDIIKPEVRFDEQNYSTAKQYIQEKITEVFRDEIENNTGFKQALLTLSKQIHFLQLESNPYN
tara:strand:- start:152 stop:592 length:441 start_codon:yes stop_codon:yes gene_type:complete